jgi:signal transduction histidine kinase
VSGLRPTIRHLLLGLNAAILAVPLSSILLLPVFDAYLLRQTERILIAESVVVGEAWRDRWLAARGLPTEAALDVHEPGRAAERFTPFAAVLDLDYEILAPRSEPSAQTELAVDPMKRRAGEEIRGLLERAQGFNLSGVRVLDEQGCVVAASRGIAGGCLADHEEVRAALAGAYAAVVRRRISDEPPPPINSIRRRGNLRVFTALPVFEDGKVVAVVRMSRTSVSPFEAIWTHRGKVGLVLVLSFIATPLLTYALSHAISRPVRTLRTRADAVAAGEPRAPFAPGALTPRELVALSEAIDHMTDQLAQREQYVLEFATHVSHELKTPIAAIAGAVELLREQAEEMSEAQRQRFLANIASDAERMERLVRRLLLLARIQHVSEDADAQPIDVAAFLEGLRTRAPERIRVEVEPGLPPLSIGPDRLVTAVGNLLDNALRHGGDAPVVLRARRAGERTAIEVSDQGPGIRPSQRERIFERFYTTERDRGGSGLGLTLARAIAESRNGSLELVEAERGTTFRLLL